MGVNAAQQLMNQTSFHSTLFDIYIPVTLNSLYVYYLSLPKQLNWFSLIFGKLHLGWGIFLVKIFTVLDFYFPKIRKKIVLETNWWEKMPLLGQGEHLYSSLNLHYHSLKGHCMDFEATTYKYHLTFYLESNNHHF